MPGDPRVPNGKIPANFGAVGLFREGALCLWRSLCTPPLAALIGGLSREENFPISDCFGYCHYNRCELLQMEPWQSALVGHRKDRKGATCIVPKPRQLRGLIGLAIRKVERDNDTCWTRRRVRLDRWSARTLESWRYRGTQTSRRRVDQEKFGSAKVRHVAWNNAIDAWVIHLHK